MLKYNKSLFLLCGIIFCLFSIVCFFAFPSYDDFIHANTLMYVTIWEYQKEFYMTWGGRFVSNFIMALPSFIDPQWTYYPLWTFGFVITLLLSFLFLCKKLVKDQALIIALLFFALFVTGAPSITQLFYWVTGAIHYTIGIFACILGLAVIISRERKSHWSLDFLLFLITLLSVGGSEMSLIGWQELLLTYLIIKKLKTDTWDKTLIIIIILGTIGGLISLLAPGNFIRQSEFEKSGLIFRTFSNSILHYFLFSVKLLSIPLVIVCIKFRTEIISSVEKIFSGKNENMIIKVIWAHWFFLLFTTTALAFWAMGRKPNTRAMNVVMFYYWICIPFIMWILSKTKITHYSQKLNGVISFIDRRWIFLLSVGFIATYNMQNLITDVAVFPQYHQEWTERLETLKNGRNKDVYLYPLSKTAKTTFFHDLLPRDSKVLTEVYGLKSLHFVPKEEANQKNKL